jgi:hypothetical protein
MGSIAWRAYTATRQVFTLLLVDLAPHLALYPLVHQAHHPEASSFQRLMLLPHLLRCVAAEDCHIMQGRDKYSQWLRWGFYA